MLKQVQLTFKTPSTLPELLQYKKEFALLHAFVPYPVTMPELWAFLQENIGHTTLVYANAILIGCFTQEVYSKSVSLHGICRPDIGDVVPHAKRVKRLIYDQLFYDIFITQGKDKVILKAKASNRGVVGFAWLYRFTRLQNTDNGLTVWKLTKDRYAKDQLNGIR